MTEDDSSNIAPADPLADLARLRAIAEQGRRLPLLGGRIMILWGAVIALASALHGAVVAHILPWPMASAGLIWFGLMGLAAVFSRWLHTPASASRSMNDIGNRVEKSVWQMGGGLLWLSSLAILGAAYLSLYQSGSSSLFLVFTMMPAIMFGVYAIALRVAAEVASLDQLKPFALLSLALAPVTILLANTPWQFVVMGVGVLIVSILPGHILIQLESAHCGD
ncbi:MAG: hypothetical protein ABL909_00015 [Sphingopyxis sp.]